MKKTKSIRIRNVGFLIYVIVILVFGCGRKADNDEEIKKMIIGRWKTNLDPNTLLSNSNGSYMLAEFNSNGSYREQSYSGEIDKDKECTTVDDANCIARRTSPGIAYSDSVFYYIENGNLHFQNHSTYQSREIVWLKPNTLKFNDRKFKKID